jgi:Zn-finger nucleic acid-binding protein
MNTTLRCDCEQQPLLSVADIAPGLRAHHCKACAGSLLNLDTYREWQASAPAAPMADDTLPLALFETASARACPSCARLMQRHRSGTDIEFRIDRCVACQHVWFDAGEWDALVRGGLRERLVELLSDGWQRQLQLEELRDGREAALRSRHGDDCMDELARIRAWLELQPRREELIGLLSGGW